MKPKKFAVLGDPVAKSLSPVIHHHWFELLGIDATYHKLTVAKGNLATTLPKLEGYGGFNITVPLKGEAFRLAATTDGLAQKAEAVNTLYQQIENNPQPQANPQSQARWAGTNTDVFGITAPLDEAKPNWRTTTQKAVVLGAGGAAAGVLVAIEGITKGTGGKPAGGDTGKGTGEGKPTGEGSGKGGGNPTHSKRSKAKTIVVNRTPKTVYGGIKTTPLEQLPEALENADLVINTVPLDFAQLSLKALASLERLAAGAVVFDIVYTRHSELLAQAGKRGFVVIEGTKMLAYQAQQSFKRWHRITPSVDAALLRVLASHITKQE